MSTVAQHQTPSKAYYAWLDEDHGILTQDAHGQVWFRNSATDDITAITPEHYNFLSVNGEVGLAECARLADVRRGGAAAVACSREEGVS
jgi:hypothetical protein